MKSIKWFLKEFNEDKIIRVLSITIVVLLYVLLTVIVVALTDVNF